jgi:hypothetical protein
MVSARDVGGEARCIADPRLDRVVLVRHRGRGLFTARSAGMLPDRSTATNRLEHPIGRPGDGTVGLIRAVYESFSRDEELAQLGRRIDYEPRVAGWRMKRAENPAKHWWQGVTRGRLDNAIDLIVSEENGVASSRRLGSSKSSSCVHRGATTTRSGWGRLPTRFSIFGRNLGSLLAVASGSVRSLSRHRTHTAAHRR